MKFFSIFSSTVSSALFLALLWVGPAGAASVATNQTFDQRIFGEWQLTEKNGEVKYVSIFLNRLNQLRMVRCEMGYNREGLEVGVVVCPASVTSGLILKPFKNNQFKVATSGHAFTKIEVNEAELKLTGLFGYFSENWTRADQDLLFVFGGK